MRVALVHDYLREYGGAERVVEAFHEIWPDAPLYTSFVDWKSLGSQAYRFRSWDIRPSWVQGQPLVRKFISPLRFLAPKVWGSFDFSDYDVVISSSGWFISRGINAGAGSTFFDASADKSTIENTRITRRRGKPVHICYIHHPPRNLYGYATGSTYQKYAWVRWYASIVNFYMRHYDFTTAQRVDYFIANSRETQRRVWKFYRRESTVIYPPIEVISAQPVKKRGYYISVGRLAWAKRIDLAIAACNRLKLPLKIVGVGREEKSLRSLAGDTIEFLGGLSDAELAKAYAGAKALIFCALDEDFGMVPVEAMAHGTPVIGLAQGGVKETVIDGKTGVLFSQPEVDDLVRAIRRFETLGADSLSVNCIKHAQKFNPEDFKREIIAFVNSHLAGKTKLT